MSKMRLILSFLLLFSLSVSNAEPRFFILDWVSVHAHYRVNRQAQSELIEEFQQTVDELESKYTSHTRPNFDQTEAGRTELLKYEHHVLIREGDHRVVGYVFVKKDGDPSLVRMAISPEFVGEDVRALMLTLIPILNMMSDHSVIDLVFAPRYLRQLIKSKFPLMTFLDEINQATLIAIRGACTDRLPRR